MSASELLELPDEFRGLPDRRKRLAFDVAQAMLPYPALLAYLGTETAELALVYAAAHVLAVSGATDTSAAGIEPMPAQPKRDGAAPWAGSAYGDAVAAILHRLPRLSGRGRRYPVVA